MPDLIDFGLAGLALITGFCSYFSLKRKINRLNRLIPSERLTAERELFRTIREKKQDYYPEETSIEQNISRLPKIEPSYSDSDNVFKTKVITSLKQLILDLEE